MAKSPSGHRQWKMDYLRCMYRNRESRLVTVAPAQGSLHGGIFDTYIRCLHQSCMEARCSHNSLLGHISSKDSESHEFEVGNLASKWLLRRPVVSFQWCILHLPS